MDAITRTIEFKFSADADEQKVGTFTGYGAVFGNIDSYGDVIEEGAFKDTLRAWEDKGKYPPMLLQHGGGMFGGTATDGIPVGKWTSMKENSRGLKVEGFIDPIDTDEGRKIYAGLKNGGLDGLSIGFRTVKERLGTKPTEARRYLEAVDLMELSIVTFPANDKARVGNVKAALAILDPREVEDSLREAGLSRSDAKKASAVVRNMLRRDAGEPKDALRDEDAAAEAIRAIAARFKVLRGA